MRKSHLEPSEKKMKKTKSEKLAILRRYTPSVEFVTHFWPFWPFSPKPLFSRGFHYYGMILLYFWVRFGHFPQNISLGSKISFGFVSFQFLFLNKFSSRTRAEPSQPTGTIPTRETKKNLKGGISLLSQNRRKRPGS